MLVANFFDRSAAAMAQVIQGSDPRALRSKLCKLAIIIAFDCAAATSSEGAITLELVTDLLARLYPGLSLTPLDQHPATLALADKLRKVALSIHRRIELNVRPTKACLCLVAGETDPGFAIPTLFMGSHGWTAFRGDNSPVCSANTGNPFGAAAAACIAAADAFRMTFSDMLHSPPPVGLAEFDALHQEARACTGDPAVPPEIDLGGTHLVGLGAIGRATAWTLARVPSLRGRLIGVDPETIELTNLQRYVGSTQADQERSRLKTRSVVKMFDGTGVQFEGYSTTWGGYLAARPKLRTDLVAVALDSAAGRIAIQASLPLAAVNAWTQPGDLGVSRHGFMSGPCLACLYMPDGKVPSLSDRIAVALKLPELEIRARLHAGLKVDRAFTDRVAIATGVDALALQSFEGSSLSAFYAKAVCGTAHFSFDVREERGAAAVPMAFQSALAGVLLAVEVLAARCSIRAKVMPALTKVDLMKKMGPFLKEPAAKHRSGRCICQDPIYLSAYRTKHAGHLTL